MRDSLIDNALTTAIKNTKGAFAAVLFEMTGIIVSKIDPSERSNVDNAAMAYVELILASKRASLAAGGDGQVDGVITYSNLTYVLMERLDDDYLIGMGIAINGNLGQARLAIRKLKPEIREILG
ncbi:hypothetical protein K8R78_03170 [bacterium]|nr:hypothetical protein [bacterium]